MVDPVTAITAAAIAKIAFEEFAKAASSEGAKQAVGGAIISKPKSRLHDWTLLWLQGYDFFKDSYSTEYKKKLIYGIKLWQETN